MRSLRPFFVCALPVMALAAGGCSRPAAPVRHTAAVTVPHSHLTSAYSPFTPAQATLPRLDQVSGYVGDRACERCHKSIFEEQQISGHALTLHAVTARTDGRIFKSSQRIRDSFNGATYSVSVQGGKCLFNYSKAGTAEPIAASLAIGSGRKGVSYFGIDDRDQWLVMRLSHYTAAYTWDYTPGMERSRSSELHGQPLRPRQVAACLSCHVTTLFMDEKNPDLSASRLGVGCERCHGPGKEHVAAMSAPLVGKGPQKTYMESLDQASANHIMELCGMCHSADSRTIADGADTGAALYRFQSTAFSISRCFTQSTGFSCITCHDPHANVATATASYEAACRSCHHSGSVHPPADATGAKPLPSITAKVCPVNASHGCISCHMPAGSAPDFPHSTFHQHWIRVWPSSRQGTSTGAA